MAYQYPFIANYLLMKIFKNGNGLISLDELKENQGFRTDLNEQCLADLCEDHLIIKVIISKIDFYQINDDGLYFIKKSLEKGLENLKDD